MDYQRAAQRDRQRMADAALTLPRIPRLRASERPRPAKFDSECRECSGVIKAGQSVYLYGSAKRWFTHCEFCGPWPPMRNEDHLHT